MLRHCLQRLHARHRFGSLGLLAIAAIAVITAPRPATAAEILIFKISFLRESVEIDDLAAFAATGEASHSLESYLRQGGSSPEELKALLTTPIPAVSLDLYRQLKTPVGELGLQQISRYVHTPDDKANVQSMRAALVGSVLPDDEFTILEVLQNYPTREVHIEGDRLLELLELLERLNAISTFTNELGFPVPAPFGFR
ncbi:alpha/beta hydrolase of unknown function (DUF1400) [Rubidibacter lacunae KORDI 51-2]|uniref:DUF1400 domain-containing protein n=1 Tax=Rubidibacter lacunae KORDI 51-2 TaxID=582515 RepID=U5DB48_9CHRO|nr:alpha/beta hydrolase [Rubidibacter lacunae]ERN41768.1 alpha/beta hydrolase of unknown function (DUF1400) [Rubidibacter lacunae KORDI 51-2]